MGKFFFSLLFLSATVALAQHGTARAGYYPNGYAGSLFTGKVSQATDDSLTLTYTNGSRTETFTGRLRGSCDVPRADGSGKRMEPSELPIGAVITAYYIGSTKKVDGVKQKENDVFAISFVEFNGITVKQQKMFWCTPSGAAYVFKVF